MKKIYLLLLLLSFGTFFNTGNLSAKDRFYETYGEGFYYLPKNYHPTDPSRKMHVLVISHGDSLYVVDAGGRMLDRYARYADRYNLVMISALYYQTDKLFGLIDRLNVYKNRLFFTGFSSGGKQAIVMATKHSNRFIGMMAHCSGYLNDYVIPKMFYYKNWQNIPLMITCGLKDNRHGDAEIGILRLEQFLKKGITYKTYRNLDHALNSAAIWEDIKFINSIIRGTYKKPRPYSKRIGKKLGCQLRCNIDCDRKYIKPAVGGSKKTAEYWNVCLNFCKARYGWKKQYDNKCRIPTSDIEN